MLRLVINAYIMNARIPLQLLKLVDARQNGFMGFQNQAFPSVTGSCESFLSKSFAD